MNFLQKLFNGVKLPEAHVSVGLDEKSITKMAIALVIVAVVVIFMVFGIKKIVKG